MNNLLLKRFSKVELLGRLLAKKEIHKKIITLSEEVSISIHNFSKKYINYNLLLINKDKNNNSTWENLTFD